MTDDTREVHEHVLSLLSPGDTTSVLDLGCGRGEHLGMLARMMPAGARLVGIDLRESMLEEARAAVDGDERFRFLQHDVNERLPFEDGEFDRVLSVNALEAIPAKEVFAREAHRTLQAGGQLVCAHYDWESQLYDGPDKEVVRRIVRGFADWKQSWMASSDGWMGRRIWRVFQESRVFEGRMHAYTHTSTSYEPGCYGWERSRDCKGLVKRGIITEAEYDAFIDGLERLAAQQRYFFAITMFSYVGVKVA
jgi:ubiquinone/menaquinone biosynthesis C-methylase UbiE